jgi:hypothetical protein
MEEIVMVVKNNGETAEFSDGSSIIRQRPAIKVDGINYSQIIPVQTFRFVFEGGLTKTQVNQRLENPDGVDGQPMGDNLITTKVSTNKVRPAPNELSSINERLRKG